MPGLVLVLVLALPTVFRLQSVPRRTPVSVFRLQLVPRRTP
ncbi:hypothetical protein [Microbacterium sp. Leaf320]|nr:hypothetical protein [Microbacterium sp. Leaf320]